MNKLQNKANVKLDELKEAGLYLLGEYRLRQTRSFPVVIPHNPVVYVIWPVKIPDQHRLAIIGISRKVVSVRHSASLVQMWFEDNSLEATWIPVDGAAIARMRIACDGRLKYLEDRYNRNNVVR